MQNEVREAALRLLDYQDRSAGELRDRLRKKSYPEREIEETVRALQECGLVDDRRYAALFAESKLSAGKGRTYIINKLREKKISQEIIGSVMEELLEHENESHLCLRKALSVCGLSGRWEVNEDGEIEKKTDFFDIDPETEEDEPLGYFEPKDASVRADWKACRAHREKAKAKVVRRLVSSGFSPGDAFDAVSRIERL